MSLQAACSPAWDASPSLLYVTCCTRCMQSMTMSAGGSDLCGPNVQQTWLGATWEAHMPANSRNLATGPKSHGEAEELPDSLPSEQSSKQQ